MGKLGVITVFLLGVGSVFWLIEALFPSVPGYRRLRPGIRTDLAYLLFNPLVTKAVTHVAVILTVIVLAVISGAALNKESIETAIAARQANFSHLPKALQIFLILFLSDFAGYWVHRAFHRGRLWHFHAVHHSSKQLDWLASVRVHPVNDILARMAQLIPFFFLGFDPKLLAGFVPFLTLYAIFFHANVSWGFGPLRWVIATPLFHRWHHTSQAEGRDKNFAGLFPFWDWLFGTLYLPGERIPMRFGVEPDTVPTGFFAQLLYPFARAKAIVNNSDKSVRS